MEDEKKIKSRAGAQRSQLDKCRHTGLPLDRQIVDSDRK
jgi:hypothetical protein